MKCLDSDILIGILRNDEYAVRHARKLDEEGPVNTTSVSCFEVLMGARRSNRQENIVEARKLLAKMTVIPFDEKASDKASELHEEFRKAGSSLELRDLFIASVAASNGYTIVTRNVKDFSRVKGLAIEKW